MRPLSVSAPRRWPHRADDFDDNDDDDDELFVVGPATGNLAGSVELLGDNAQRESMGEGQGRQGPASVGDVANPGMQARGAANEEGERTPTGHQSLDSAGEGL